MWLVLLAAAISAIAWVADLKASHIPVRAEQWVPDKSHHDINAEGGGVSRLLD